MRPRSILGGSATRPVCIDIGYVHARGTGSADGHLPRTVCRDVPVSVVPAGLSSTSRFTPGFEVGLDGVETEHITGLMSARDRLRPGVFPHVYLLCKLQSRDASTRRNVRKDLRAAGFTAALITHSREAHAAPRRTADVAPGAVDLVGVRRRHTIRRRAQEAVCPSSAHRACVWDLGCHTGEYACADRVIAVDADHLAIDRLSRAEG